MSDPRPAFQISPMSAMTSAAKRLPLGRMTRNSLFAFVQSIIVTVGMFASFRIVVQEVGLDLLGVWFLLLAGSAFARVGDVSGAGALSRFVAMRSYRDQKDWAIESIHTVLITSVGLNLVICSLFGLAAPFVIDRYFDPNFQQEALALVPYALLNMLLGSLAVAMTSGIDGTQRADQRAIVLGLATVAMVLVCFFLVPRMGLFGFVLAQLSYQAFIIIVGWFVMRRHVPGLGLFPLRWRWPIFRETTGFAVKLSAIGIVAIFFEPLAKFTMNHVGGLASVTLYEMASRLVVRMRDLIVAAALPLVPAFASHKHADTNAFRDLLYKTSRVASIAASINTAMILAVGPLVSIAMFNEVSWAFVTMTACLAAAWNAQLPAIAHYFAAQGQGVLRWNFVSHAIVSVFVLLSAYTFAETYGVYGLLAGIVAGFVASLIPIYFFNAVALKARSTLSRTARWIVPSMVTTLAMVALYIAALSLIMTG
jgi:O-antigen/teichoic acid export membrane protein